MSKNIFHYKTIFLSLISIPVVGYKVVHDVVRALQTAVSTALFRERQNSVHTDSNQRCSV
jgi:hypothetical protein